MITDHKTFNVTLLLAHHDIESTVVMVSGGFIAWSFHSKSKSFHSTTGIVLKTKCTANLKASGSRNLSQTYPNTKRP